MNYYNPQTPPPFRGGDTAVREQANSIMKRVYVRMFAGLLISAFCALGVATTPAAYFLFANKFIYYGMFIAMLAMAFIIPARITRMSTSTCLLLFCLFSALMGTSLAPIFIVYRLGTIVYTFFIAAGTFGAMSVYGYFTKSDLTKFGTYLIMALIGLIILSIVNIFFASNGLDWVISIVGLLIFVGLTAFDTQQVKRLAAANLEPAMADKLATMGALNLYLDFINLFLYLLRIFGGRD
ncbi:MAG: Bax inhibitor-1/YccA family protein [Muribaculaceae bacterium]|nr:Bax inhibitor-1/YccA family protein [Muribaculaceae bacterium]